MTGPTPFSPEFIAVLRHVINQLEHPDALKRLERLAALLAMADAKQ